MYNDNSLPNYYLILGLTNDSSQSEIKTQYRKLAKQYHPDRNKNSSEEKMSQIAFFPRAILALQPQFDQKKTAK